MPDARDFPDERWAARLGRVAPGLWQLETLQKYGHYQPLDEAMVVGAQVNDGYLLNRGVGSFFAGWNYILGMESSAAARFTEAAGLLEGACALPLPPRQHLLCLREPIRVEHPHTRWALDESHLDASPAARVIEALLAPGHALRRGSIELVVGLHSREFGWVHTGALTLFFEGTFASARAEWVMTGQRNPLADERVDGPYADSISMARPEPVLPPTVPWPFEPW
ncbi:hypothetical protein HPC49_06830 [Pyxidicoccus fallax]|uniref:Uncharacterized protein n=2 Tax=Pyxidicoccus fallax TaxID=394095 RepID=A0A848LI73_9BACT|nr:hypothetical protein [Pyxidicoccus fallax]NPC77968.1 hypothetical protein [Pyxidicoccus fallax]